MIKTVNVPNNNCEKFSYPAYTKNTWLIYALLSLLLIAPLPLYGYIFFDKDFDVKIILIFWVLGISLAVIYRNLNRKNKCMYRDVYVCDDGVVVCCEKDGNEVAWDKIVAVKEFGRGSKYNLNSAGDEGFLLIKDNGEEIAIFSSINNYNFLKKLIEDKIAKS